MKQTQSTHKVGALRKGIHKLLGSQEVRRGGSTGLEGVGQLGCRVPFPQRHDKEPVPRNHARAAKERESAAAYSNQRKLYCI